MWVAYYLKNGIEAKFKYDFLFSMVPQESEIR
jgi:hypothetical protein